MRFTKYTPKIYFPLDAVLKDKDNKDLKTVDISDYFFNEYKDLFITGDFGHGKTSTLEYLEYKENLDKSKDATKVYLINLPQKFTYESLLKIISRKIYLKSRSNEARGLYKKKDFEKYIMAELENREVLMLLDNLDIESQINVDSDDNPEEELETLIKTFPSFNYVIASRKKPEELYTFLNDNVKQFDHLEIKKIDVSDTTDNRQKFFKCYTENYKEDYKDIDDNAIDKLIDIIDNSNISNIADIPFFLWAMLFVFAQNKSIDKFPKNLSQFYDELINKIAAYNEERKFELENLGITNEEVLPTIAFRMNAIRSGKVSEDYAFRNFGATTSDKLELLKSGLLVDNGNRFLHDSIRDYYCGKYLYNQLYKNENRSIEDIFKKYAKYEFFEEPLKFFIAFFYFKESNNTKSLNDISDFIIKYFNLLPTFFADVISYCGKFITDDLKSETISFLRNLLSKDYPINKVIFINTIVKLLNVLEIKLRNGPEIIEKIKIINGKIYLDSKFLMNFLEEDFSSLKYLTLQAISKLGDKDSLKDIIPVLKDSSEHVRWTAVNALAKLGGKDSLKGVIPMLKDTSEHVRWTAVKAIAKLGGKDSLKDIIPMLKDKNEWVRHDAVEIISELGDKNSLRDIIPMLKDSSEYVRRSAVEAISELGDKNSLKDIIPMLKDSSEYVRRSAVEAISELGGKDSLKDIIPMLKDSSEHVRLSAVEAISELGDKNNVKDIIPMLKDSSEYVRRSAVEAILILGTIDIEQIIKFRENSDFNYLKNLEVLLKRNIIKIKF